MKIKLNILFAISAFFVLFTVSEVFAIDDNYEILNFKLEKNPTVCALEPYETHIGDAWKKISQYSRTSVLDWQTHLQSTTKNDEFWKIDFMLVPLEQQKEKPWMQDQCDVEIHFQREPYENKFLYAGLTSWQTGKPIITIYYLNVEVEREMSIVSDEQGTYRLLELIPYYTDYLIPEAPLTMTIKHELGHAFGLGHYITNDQEKFLRWEKGAEAPPSIMIEVKPIKVISRDITQLDIEKLLLIYGDDGFFDESYVESQVFDTLRVSQYLFSISENGLNFGIVSGKLNQNVSVDNEILFVTIVHPDGNEEIIETIPNENKFETKFVIHNASQLGTYHLYANYKQEKSSSVLFEVVKEPIQEFQINDIPDWIKNNAKWWAKGSISDDDFSRGIQYLIKQNILMLPDDLQIQSSPQKEIPNWIRNNAGWWAENIISDEDFLFGLQYLVENQIIKV